MAFKHKSAPAKDLQNQNPFIAGQDRAYADILLDKMRETRRWRFVGFMVIVLFVINLVLFVNYSNQQKTVPVLINVMPSGESQYLGEVKQSGSVQVPEAAVLWQVRRFITNIRAVSADPQVVYDNLNQCYKMITAGYEGAFTRYLKDNSPLQLAGKTRRTVEFETVLRTTARSYQVDWREESVAGQNKSSARFRAIVTVVLLSATDETIKDNPLGIYINGCDIAELQ